MNNSERDKYIVDIYNRIDILANRTDRIEGKIDRILNDRNDNQNQDIAQLRNDVRNQGLILDKIKRAFNYGQ